LKRRPVRLTPRLRDFLLSYAYPGNIRELRNVMYRISCLAGDMADVEHLPLDMRPAAPGSVAAVSNGTHPGGQQPISVANLMSLSDAKRAASDDAEKAYLERGLRETSGTVAELARRIEMNRSHLQMLLKKHGLHSKDFRNRNAPSAKNGADERDEEDAEG
jgi:DNA-binding NtrC family response regulator